MSTVHVEYCPSCEQMVHTAFPHSCYDAKAVRAQQERERTLTVQERVVVTAAVAWVQSLNTEEAKACSKGREELGAPAYYDASQALYDAVRALDRTSTVPDPLVGEILRLRRILAALREPSAAVIAHAVTDYCDPEWLIDTIRAAVTAAEQEHTA